VQTEVLHFGNCIRNIQYYRLALCFFAKQHKQAQEEALYNLSMLYNAYGLGGRSYRDIGGPFIAAYNTDIVHQVIGGA
jgi:hypothetical protein